MYEQFFGLEDEPFRLTPDPRYLYLSPKHAEALAHLRLGLTESSGFVCITGDVGTGKTTLLRSFLTGLGPNITAAYAFVPPLSAVELLRRICRDFGLTVAGQSQADLTEELYAFLVAQHAAGCRCVVVLDEAQALSVELLEQIRLLLNLETSTQKLLCIVLVGQPQLRKLLLDPGLAQLNQRITLRWHLGPLSYRETAAYVEHRLTVASGGRPTHLFTVPALRLLHSVAGGVPRLINMVAHRALLVAFIARERRVDRRLVARAYREIQAVPLPGTLSRARKVALAAGGLAIGVGLVAFGAPLLDWLLRVPQRAAPAAPAANAVLGGDVASPPPQDAPPPTQQPAIAPVAVATAVPLPVPRPEPLASAEALAGLLATIEGDSAAAAATDVLLKAWDVRGLAPGESQTPDNLEVVAWRRGLQALTLTGNRSMLHLLDLPAVLALNVPGVPGTRYVALSGMDASRAVLVINGVPATLDVNLLDRVWSGQAHILWRDFDGLGPRLQRGARGVTVVHLQGLLGRVGALQGEPTGAFDGATEGAVAGFQRTHFLQPDGIVGPLTNIVLYAAAGGYRRPTLDIPAAQGAS